MIYLDLGIIMDNLCDVCGEGRTTTIDSDDGRYKVCSYCGSEYAGVEELNYDKQRKSEEGLE